MIGPHQRLGFRFSSSMLMAAMGALLWFVAPASAQIVPVSLAGSTSYDGWSNMTRSGFPGYPDYPGSAAWSQPMGSNLGQGDAELQRLAGGTTTGGPFPAEESLYFGSFRQVPNDLGGTLRVADGTPVSGVKTVVLQIQIGEAEGYDFFSPSGAPVLKVNGEAAGQVPLAPVLISRFQSGTFESPETGLDEPVFVNTWGFQWDVSSLGLINSLQIDFSAVTHAQIYEVRLDQSDVAQGRSVFVPAFLNMIAMGIPQYDGSSTSVTHGFAGPPSSILTVEYTESVGQSPWVASAPVETGSGSFGVTFTTPGDRRAAWSRNMFFRARYPSDL